MILGGKPIASCDIVYYLRKKNVYTIVTDYLSKDQSPAKQIANEAWNISTSEIDILCSEMEEHGVRAIFTGCHEFNIDKALRIAQILKIPFYSSPKTYKILSNKASYKQLFSNVGLPVIREFYRGEYEKIVFKDIDYPVIVKPVDGSGGNGVRICTNEEELRANSVYAGGISKIRHIIVEECMESPEVTIFYIARNGKILLSAMADRETRSFRKGVIPLPVMYTFPSVHLSDYERYFNEKVVSVLSEVGVRDGMLFMQAFWRDGKVYIYDVGYRLTGTQEYNLLSRICGYNPLEMMVDYALTGRMGEKDIEPLVDPRFGGKYAGIVTCLMMPGTIKEFVGIQEIEQADGVVKFLLNHEVGETVSEERLGTLGQVAARAFVVADEKEQLEEIRKRVMSVLKVISIDGKDLLIR